MPRLVTAFCLCVLIVSFGGCSRPSSKIVGKWQAIDANGRSAYEFFNDGSAMRRSGLDWVKGKWRFLDDGRLLVEATVFGTAVAETYDVTFDCETAIFKDSNGKKTKFSKVNDFVSLSDTEGNKGNVNVSADKEKWKSDIKKAEQKVEEKVKEFESKAK